MKIDLATSVILIYCKFYKPKSQVSDIKVDVSLGITSYSCNMVYSKHTFIHGTVFTPFTHFHFHVFSPVSWFYIQKNSCQTMASKLLKICTCVISKNFGLYFVVAWHRIPFVVPTVGFSLVYLIIVTLLP